MEEIFRTNDPVKLSYAEHLLMEADVEYVVLDRHISAVEGNIGAFPRRIMVKALHAERARRALVDLTQG
jgi:hypothetical protein